MRRGLVSVDWAIGIGVFLIFVAISFSYYSAAFPPGDGMLEDVSGYVVDQILDEIKVDVYDVPIRFNSPGSATDQVFFFNYTWPYGKNTTKIYSGSTSLPCYISGDVVYWKADVSAGYNYFKMRYSNQSVAMRCTSSLTLTQLNKTAPWAEEHQRMFSQTQIDTMTGTGYGAFSDSLDLNMDFRIYINESGTVTQYGKTPPNATSVRVMRRWGVMEDTGNDVEVRLLVW